MPYQMIHREYQLFYYLNRGFRGSFWLISVLLLLSWSSVAQKPEAVRYSEQITTETIKKHIAVLASDSLEGRETATPGMKKAANYVSGAFQSSGVQPAVAGSYFQQMPFIRQSASSVEIKTENRSFIFGSDYVMKDVPPLLELQNTESVFAGYGIVDSASGWNDYRSIDIKGKVVLMLDGEPFGKKGKSPVTGTKEPSAWSKSDESKIKIASAKGASAILVIKKDLKDVQRLARRWTPPGRLRPEEKSDEQIVPVIYISENMADEWISKTGTTVSEQENRIVKSSKPNPFTLQQSFGISIASEKTFCTNIAGMVKGTDKKEEVIVVSAHIDHLGKRDGKIYYGADDDASGCASVMAIAEQFARAAKEGNGPRRTLLFVTFSAEEKGLLGSRYYVNNPVFPLENTIANLNIDMIGRSDTMPRHTTNYTYIIGSDKLSSDLHMIHENTNAECCEVALDYKYNDEKDPLRLYYRSDHYNFVKNNIPAIFYFTGLHEDYHQPTDTADKIDPDKTVNITRLIFHTAWELANREERISLD